MYHYIPIRLTGIKYFMSNLKLPDYRFQMPFPTERNQGFLGKQIVPSLGKDKYKTIMGYFVIIEIKEEFKTVKGTQDPILGGSISQS